MLEFARRRRWLGWLLAGMVFMAACGPVAAPEEEAAGASLPTATAPEHALATVEPALIATPVAPSREFTETVDEEPIPADVEVDADTLRAAAGQIEKAQEIVLQAVDGISAAEIEVVSVQAVQWRDSSLGCPREGLMYMQVITPGYEIVMTAGGQKFLFHTDLGDQVVRCDE